MESTMNQSGTLSNSSGASQLELSHPHIVKRLCVAWGYPEGARYLAELLVDGRGGRAGFSDEVFSDLLTLANGYPALPLGPATIAGSPELSKRRASR
jgi:hypothetical protein